MFVNVSPTYLYFIIHFVLPIPLHLLTMRCSLHENDG
jgi:hypothetical protein